MGQQRCVLRHLQYVLIPSNLNQECRFLRNEGLFEVELRKPCTDRTSSVQCISNFARTRSVVTGTRLLDINVKVMKMGYGVNKGAAVSDQV